MVTQKAHWQDKQKYSNIWSRAIERSSVYFGNGDFRKYFRTVDCLVMDLFKDDRENVREYQKSIQKDWVSHTIFVGDIEKKRYEYNRLKEYVVNRLEKEGYFSKKTEIPESGTQLTEEELEEYKDGTSDHPTTDS